MWLLPLWSNCNSIGGGVGVVGSILDTGGVSVGVEDSILVGVRDAMRPF